MIRHLRVVAGDVRGLWKACGPWIALRWLASVIFRFRTCAKVGHLQPADALIGAGPISVRLGHARAKLGCERVLTGVREIWARDCYLGGGFLSIGPQARVMDLGANNGCFTALALAHGPQVHVLAVEADPLACDLLRHTLNLNGWLHRVEIVTAFVGGRSSFQQQLIDERCSNVPSISEDELLERIGGRIDFLKCDIEGSEFELFTPDSQLLRHASQVAVELHPHAGDHNAIIELLKSMEFELRREDHPPTINILARRR